MEILVSGRHIGRRSREIGRLRQAGRETEAAELETRLNELVRQAHTISLSMTIDAVSDILRGRS